MGVELLSIQLLEDIRVNSYIIFTTHENTNSFLLHGFGSGYKQGQDLTQFLIILR